MAYSIIPKDQSLRILSLFKVLKKIKYKLARVSLGKFLKNTKTAVSQAVLMFSKKFVY